MSIEGTGLATSSPGYIDIRHDGDGQGIIEAGSEILFTLARERLVPTGQCAPADGQRRLTWSTGLDAGQYVLGSVMEGPDGCVELELRDVVFFDDDAPGTREYLCLPPRTFPFSAGDAIEISFSQQPSALAGAVSALRISAIDGETGIVVPDGDALVASTGNGIADVFGATATHDALQDCGPALEAACGTVSRAGSITLVGGVTTPVELLGAGARMEAPGIHGGTISFHLVHAQDRVVLDPECAQGPDMLGRDVELVAVRRAAAQ
jgi:hypothetical protein